MRAEKIGAVCMCGVLIGATTVDLMNVHADLGKKLTPIAEAILPADLDGPHEPPDIPIWHVHLRVAAMENTSNTAIHTVNLTPIAGG